eukprot:1388462-Alexandrium_andersonii.AAC.1
MPTGQTPPFCRCPGPRPPRPRTSNVPSRIGGLRGRPSGAGHRRGRGRGAHDRAGEAGLPARAVPAR